MKSAKIGSHNSGTWPNLIRFNVTGTNVVASGQPIVTGLYYQYAGASTNLSVQYYLGGDFNSLGTNNTFRTQVALPKTGANSVFFTSAAVGTVNVPPGTYSVFGKISDGTHSRYLYAPQLVQILPASPVLGIVNQPGQLTINVTGVLGQKIVLQSSADLQTWQPLATNLNFTGSWLYPISNAPSSTLKFFRAMTF